MFRLSVLRTPQAFSPSPRTPGLAALVGAAMLLAISGSAQEKPGAPVPSPAESKQAPAESKSPETKPPDNKPAEFVGSTTCQMCHDPTKTVTAGTYVGPEPTPGN